MTTPILHRRPRRHLRAGALALACLLAPATLLAGPAAAAPAPTDVRPGQLERSETDAVHVVGNVLVQGDVRTRVGKHPAHHVGQSLNGHVLISGRKVVRITADGTRHVIAKGVTWAELASDGETLWTERYTPRGTWLQQHDALTGWDGERVRVPASAMVLGGTNTKVLVVTGKRTRWLTWLTGRWSPVISKRSHRADVANNRLAYFTRDPYRGGCTVVAKLSNPSRKLWRSCSERVDAFSPGGKRMTTVALLADGLGPNRVGLRSRRGKALASYRVGKRGYIGQAVWGGPNDSTLTLQVNGPRWSTVAECAKRSCTRVAGLTRSEPSH